MRKMILSINIFLRFKRLLILAILSFFSANFTFLSQNKPNYWDQVQVIKEYDKIYKPSKNPIVFVGSSSIRMWRIAERVFSKYDVLNRGIGGAVVNDITFYADQLIFDYNPRQVVIYVGENDLQNPSLTAHTLFQRVQKLLVNIREKLPNVPITYISIKPSPARLFAKKTLEKTNFLIEQYIKSQQNMTFVDIYKPMIQKEGTYRPELFLKDQLHMNSKGYKIWQKAIKPHLIKII